MKEIKQFYRKTKAKIKKKLEGYPGYNRLVRLKNDIAEHIRKGLLAFFSAIGPIWTFLFVKTPKTDQPVSDEPTDTRSRGFWTIYQFLLTIYHYRDFHQNFIKIAKVFPVRVHSLEQPAKCLQKTKNSPIQAYEVWHNKLMYYYNFSFMASRVASDEK